jgi:hypothetical protein
MFLVDTHYVAVASFVQGLDSATGGELLDDFSSWLAGRRAGPSASIVWAWQVVYACLPHVEMDDRPLASLTPEESTTAVAALFDELEAYLGDRVDGAR